MTSGHDIYLLTQMESPAYKLVQPESMPEFQEVSCSREMPLALAMDQQLSPPLMV